MIISFREEFMMKFNLPKNIGFIRSKNYVNEFRLSNGLKIITSQNNDVPDICLSVIYYISRANDNLDELEILNFIKEYFYNANFSYDQNQNVPIKNIYNFLNIKKTTEIWYDATVSKTRLLGQYLELVLKIESSFLNNFKFNLIDFEKISTLVKLDYSYNHCFGNEFNDTLLNAYKFHPYRYVDYRNLNNIENMTLDNIEKFYNKYFKVSNTCLTVVGNFDTVNLLDLFDKYFSPINHSPYLATKPNIIEPQQNGLISFESNYNDTPARIYIATHRPEMSHKDNYVFELVDYILGNDEAAYGRLYKRLALYDNYLWFRILNLTLIDPGLFVFYANFSDEKEFKKIQRIYFEEVDKLATKKITKSELDSFKNIIRNEYLLNLSDIDKFSENLVLYEVSQNWFIFFDYLNNIDKVTSKDINEIAQKYFNKNNTTIGCFNHPDKTNQYYQPYKLMDLNSVKVDDSFNDFKVTPKDTNFSIKTLNFEQNTTLAQLENGINILVYKTIDSNFNKDIVGISGNINIADYNMLKDNLNITRYFGEVLFKECKAYNYFEIHYILNKIMPNPVFTRLFFDWNENLTFECIILKKDIEEYLKIVIEILTRPKFTKKYFNDYKYNELYYLKKKINQADSVANKYFNKLIFPKTHLYYNDSADLKYKQSQKWSIDLFYKYHKKAFKPQNLTLSLAGNLDIDELTDLIKNLTLNWSNGKNSTPNYKFPKIETKPKKIVKYINVKNAKFIAVNYGHAMNIDKEELYILNLANEILNNRFANNITFRQFLKNTTSTYFINSDKISFINSKVNTWKIKFNLVPANFKPTISLFNNIIQDFIENGPDNNEFLNNKLKLLNEFNLQLGSRSYLADLLLTHTLEEVKPAKIDNILLNYQDLNLNALNLFIKKHFHLDKCILVVAGDLKAANID